MTPGGLASLVLRTATEVLVDPPDRRYVSHGRPAGDLCEELVVWVESFGSSGLNDRPGRCVVLNDLWVRVRLTRCHPTQDDEGNPPSPADLDEHGTTLTDEAWRLWNDLIDRSLEWEADGPVWQRADVMEPEAGFASWTLSFTTRLT